VPDQFGPSVFCLGSGTWQLTMTVQQVVIQSPARIDDTRLRRSNVPDLGNDTATYPERQRVWSSNTCTGNV
jgi:hypothetical protein